VHLMGVGNKYLSNSKPSPILVFCHLRWNFVYQRPQHLLTRFQRRCDVHFWEEPISEERDSPALRIASEAGGVRVITPLLPVGMDAASAVSAQRELLNSYLSANDISRFIAWYYTGMALQFSDHLSPETTIYDCMDELSAFFGASPDLISHERTLFSRADVVFCGGASLYASKRKQHQNVHLFASSIDREHFAAARNALPDPDDQSGIPHPRIGFYGVIDERLDRDLVGKVAADSPDWHFVLLGPVVKIDQNDLPRAANIHYLGQRQYAQLPAYLANWDVAMLPFAQNASTRFISPTKTPEYLAGGKPVVSTPIQDVVRPYGESDLVKIAATAEEFAAAIQSILTRPDPTWLGRVDQALAQMSWDKTFEGMWAEIHRCSDSKPGRVTSAIPSSGGSTLCSTF
jgi:glycosyltransferase involved in cell wall biosynthesis